MSYAVYLGTLPQAGVQLPLDPIQRRPLIRERSVAAVPLKSEGIPRRDIDLFGGLSILLRPLRHAFSPPVCDADLPSFARLRNGCTAGFRCRPALADLLEDLRSTNHLIGDGR